MFGRRLATAWSRAAAAAECPLAEHPRPQLVRSSWLSLNGRWEFWGGWGPPGAGGQGEDEDPPVGQRLPGHILVPFPAESTLSGVGTPYERMWYRRTFRVPSDWGAGRVHLHFGAVDWECRVWVNGVLVGGHRGGYDAFSFDITPYLSGHEERDEEVLVHVVDPTDGGGQPLGKQRRHPGGIFYTSVSGIWQTVWLEATPSCHLSRLTLTPDRAAGAVHVLAGAVRANERPSPGTGQGAGAEPDAAVPVRVEVRAGLAADAETVATGTGISGQPFMVEIPNVRPWSPDDPFLYGVTVTLDDGQAGRSGAPDRVDSYVGMRSVEITEVDGEPRPLLNGRFVFHLGLLDQGYWPDGVYTAPTDEALRRDIEVTKELGFTCIRNPLM